MGATWIKCKQVGPLPVSQPAAAHKFFWRMIERTARPTMYCYDMTTRLRLVGGRRVKPTFAGPTVGSLRTNCGCFSLRNSRVGLPAVGLAEAGGGGGIRTPGGLAPTSDFKSGAFNHSATPPKPEVQVENLPVQVNGADRPGSRIGDRSAAAFHPQMPHSPGLPP